jgi:hypothetical protein
VTSKTIKVVKQVDGSEVLRLVPHLKKPLSPPPPQTRLAQEPPSDPWLASVTEPRLMNALATLPGPLRREDRSLAEGVDPFQVRSWAEFIEPMLALRWKTLAHLHGFAAPLLWLPEEWSTVSKVGGAPDGSMAYAAPWRNTSLSTTWRSAVSEGAKHALSGQEALQEWLMLPMPEPKANPWLSNLGSYRY